MLQNPARLSGNVQLPYTTADMAERLAKRKAAKDRQDILDSLQGGLSYGKGGVDITPQLSHVGGMVKGLIQMPAATVMDIVSGIVRPLDKYVGGVKDPVDQYRPEDYGTSNLISGTAQSLEQATRRAVGDITAIPRVGKPSASPTATDIKRLGVIEGLSKAGIDYGNLALTAAPFVKPSAFGISNAYKDMLEARLARQNRSPFPTVKTPGAFIDVDALQGSRLPARIVDSPATPATRLAEAQTQRALPPATTADMAEQLARAQARQTTHFGTVSKEPVDVIQSTEFPKLSPKNVDKGGIPNLESKIRQAISFPVYEIGGQKIAFGNPDLGRFTPEFNTKDVQFVPIDPYQITGLPKTSVEGQNFATTMFDAHQGMEFESPGTKNIGQVSALTYAASRGDNIAMQELQRLADVGKQGMNAARLAESEKILSFYKDWSNPKYWDNKPSIQVKLGTAKDGYTEIKRPLGIDDMFLVHQTDYAPTFDANGNIILKPTGDYALIDPATGKPTIDKVSGKPVANYDRDNVHFTINHLVEGHMWRNSPTGQSYVILVPLRNVLDANPGSLDNLYAIDTFLTPKPGEGLVIPMQNGRVVQGVGEETSKNVFQALQEIGKLYNQNPEYQTKIILGGQHYANTEYIDERISQLGLEDIPKEYPEYIGGVIGTTHGNHPSYFAQRFDNFDLESGKSWLTGENYWRMSPNQKLRIYDSNTSKYTTGNLNITYKPDSVG